MDLSLLPEPFGDMISLQTIELAISKGHVRSFAELDYCVFRYCEQFS